MSPLDWGINPAIIFRRVDFPQPEGPTILTNSPSSMEKDISFNAGCFLLKSDSS